MTRSRAPLSCARASHLLAEALDGSLAGGERAALDMHLRACPDCAGAFAREQRLFALLGSLQRESAPPGFAERTLAAIWPELARRRAARADRPGLGRRYWLLLPAALLVVLTLVYWFHPGLKSSGGMEGMRDVAGMALLEGGREVSGALDFLETAAARMSQALGPVRDGWQSLATVERLLRESIPPRVIAMILLVGFSPLVILFTLYRFRLKGALNHVMPHLLPH